MRGAELTVPSAPLTVPRALLTLTFVLLLTTTATACRRREPPARGGPMMPGGSMQEMMDRMPDWMMSEGSMSGMMEVMPVIHDLLMQHAKIRRTVEDLPNGIRSTTTSTDPAVAAQIRKHVWQMKGRVERGEPIRMMDPVFREIFRHHEKLRMDVEEIAGGVRVTETSDDPRVVLLIRQHAHRAVSEFVADGMNRAMRPTPLPAGYAGAE